MSKQKAIGQIRIRGERDLSISDGALRLLFRLCSHIYTNPKATLEKAFPLPWSTVAIWCGLKDDKSASRRIGELCDRGYLKCDGLRGCPGINHYFLISSCPEKGAAGCPSGGATVTPEKGATGCPSGGAHHISNSLREDKIKRKRGEFNGSLRSKETNQDELAATPKMLTDAQRLKHAQALSQLRCELTSPTGGQKPLLKKKHD